MPESTPNPLVGIVIAAYNADAYITETLESIIRQSHTSWQCVVVDDGSTDCTFAVASGIAERDGRIRVVRQNNRGQAVARNVGYRFLDPGCELVTFMDADDRYEADGLTDLIQEALSHPKAVGVHGVGEFIDAQGRPFLNGVFSTLNRARRGCQGGRPRAWPIHLDTCFETVVTASVIFPPGLILTRRWAIERAGLFDPKVRHAEDWDLLTRLTRFGDYRFLDKVVVGYRRHSTNEGASSRVQLQCARVRSKTYYSAENNEQQRRIVHDAWRASQVMAAQARFQDAKNYFRQGRLLIALVQFFRFPFIAWRYLLGRPKPFELQRNN